MKTIKYMALAGLLICTQGLMADSTIQNLTNNVDLLAQEIDKIMGAQDKIEESAFRKQLIATTKAIADLNKETDLKNKASDLKTICDALNKYSMYAAFLTQHLTTVETKIKNPSLSSYQSIWQNILLQSAIKNLRSLFRVEIVNSGSVEIKGKKYTITKYESFSKK